MWTRSHSIVTKEATKEQMWRLFADVNNWHTWDTGVEYASIEGAFEKVNYFTLKPKGGPKVRIQLHETVPGRKFVDLTNFPLAKMYGEHTFEETGEGLKITTTMTVTGPLTFLWKKVVAEKIADALPEEMIAQVKHAALL